MEGWQIVNLLVTIRRSAGATITSARLVLGAVAIVAVGLAGCSSGPPARPTTTARLQIISPQPNQVTGPNPRAQFNVIGATVVNPAVVTGKLRGNEGHIHMYIDNGPVNMAYQTAQNLPTLAPGPHVLKAEFVAIDHLAFKDPVVATVVFQVK
jgi:hypothetical protein